MSGPLSFYVAPDGRDSWSGLLPDPAPGGGDGPFRTLEAARDAVRRHRSGPGPWAGATVWLRGGDHVRTATFELDARDSGAAEAPVTYRAFPGEAPRLLGGRRLDPAAFGPVTDPAVRARLAEAVRDRVLQCDLRGQGVADSGRFVSRGFGRKTAPAHLELFVNDRPMTVAQWPDAGAFTTIAGILKPRITEWKAESGELEAGFRYDGDRPARWKPDDNIWVHGYWAYDWANSYERIRRLDPAARTIETADPYGLYYFIPGQRYYFLNVLEELDQPGEYYVDAERGLLYLLPPEPLAGADVLVSILETPLVRLADVSHVAFQGLVLEAARGTGVRIEGGAGVRLDGCTLRNLGNWGAAVEGGAGHVFAGCHIYGNGDGGIDLKGGDRATLAPCGHAVLGCHIHHIARWSRCYVAAVNAGGVGMRIAANHLHHLPHTAVLFWGNEFRIEDNEIHHACLETGDAGAIYTGRDYTFRGNAIRRNFIHHMGGVGMGSMAIYMDDCVSGTVITDNVLWDCQIGVMLGGGRDFTVERNILADCREPVLADARGISPHPVWQKMVNTTMKERLEAMRPREPPYSARYPEIAAIEPHLAAGRGVPPENNRVANNILWRREGRFRLTTEGARFDGNLYWCAEGPVRFGHGPATAVYGSQPFPQGYLAEEPRLAPLGPVPEVTGEPGEADWARARRVERFSVAGGEPEAPAGLADVRFLRRAGRLLVRALFRRPAPEETPSGPVWNREHVELLLKPYAGRSGLLQLGLALDGGTAVVWHGLAAPAAFDWKPEARAEDGGWSARLEVPLDAVAKAAGGGEPDWRFLAGFTAPAPVVDWAAWQARGHEAGGVCADPRFRDPARGDFRLLPDSPALALGFQADRPLPNG